MPDNIFPLPGTKSELETGDIFTPKFNADGLVTAIVIDSNDGQLLMVAHMNDQAISRTLETGEAHYWSRSRNELWHKGKTSGNVQKVVEIATDCDQDAVLLTVEVDGFGATCHTGQRSCFYRKVVLENGNAVLKAEDSKPLFDPEKVYS